MTRSTLLALAVLALSCSSVTPLQDAYGGGGGGGGADSGEVDVSVPVDTASVPDVAAPDAGGEDVADVPSGEVVEDTGAAADVVLPDDVPTLPDTGGGCPAHPSAGPPLGERSCALRFAVPLPPGTSSATVRSELNDWGNAGEWPLSDTDGDGTWTGEVDASAMIPGTYGYKLFLNGTDWVLDPSTPLRKVVGTENNSKLYVPDCALPELVVESLSIGAGAIDAVIAIADGTAGPVTSATATLAGEPLPCAFDAPSGRFFVAESGLPPGKHTLRVQASNEAGTAAEVTLPIWVEATAFAWADAVMYFAFVDRFDNGDPSNDGGDACMDTDDPARWMGGDWKGLLSRIEGGWFDALGVNTLWVTAPADNPSGCFTGDLPGKQYTAYHGYFPKSMTDPEERFGTMEDLRAVVKAAHARGMRVLVDLVANHVHDQHPSYGAHGDWFHPYFQCGFEEKPVECWFQPYLPDIDYTKDDAVEAFTEMALWWVREADLDGFRVDAVKHVHQNFLLTLRWRLDQIGEPTGVDHYLVGETFVGDWGGGAGPNEGTIKAYVGHEQLHGQFDFPLYWRLLQTLARNEAPLSSLGQLLVESAGFYGSDAIMATFLGNHDVPRFISHANGDIGDMWGNGSKEQGYDDPPGAPGTATAWERLRLAWTFLFTQTGIPLIYYGDEIGMPGAGDPDNRRMMQFDGLSAEQQATIAHIGKLAEVRRAHPALRGGATAVLASDADMLLLARTLGADKVVVALNRGAGSATLSGSVGGTATWTDALSGAPGGTGGTVSITLPPRSSAVLVSQ
ncbi:MAG: hypothetical protein AMXMBFR64_21350 [Myxococcales bacterium]